MYSIFSKKNIVFAILFCLGIIFSNKLSSADIGNIFTKAGTAIEQLYNESRTNPSKIKLFLSELSKANQLLATIPIGQVPAEAKRDFNILKLLTDTIKESFQKGLSDITLLNQYAAELKKCGGGMEAVFKERRTADNAQFKGFEEFLNPNVIVRPTVENTILMLAAALGCKDLVKILLDIGANPNLKAKNGLTALDLAKDADIINILKSAK